MLLGMVAQNDLWSIQNLIFFTFRCVDWPFINIIDIKIGYIPGVTTIKPVVVRFNNVLADSCFIVLGFIWVKQPLCFHVHNMINGSAFKFIVIDDFVINPILNEKALHKIVNVWLICTFSIFRVTPFNFEFNFLTFHWFLKTLNLKIVMAIQFRAY